MRRKAKPGDRATKHRRTVIPATPSEALQQLGKRHEESELDSNPKIVRSVVRTVKEGTFIHFYLACGHLISVQKDDLKGDLPTKMECWACDLWNSD